MFYAITAVHMRLYLVNFADKACVDKYIPRETSGTHWKHDLFV